MSIITNDYKNTLFNFVSFGYYGQKPAAQDYPEEIRKTKFIPQEPETYTEMCKRYVWTVLPLMTLVKPVGSVVTVVSEMAKTAKSVDLMMKYRTLQSISYNAFKTVLSTGTIAAMVIEPSTLSLHRLFTGIQFLSLAHQTALKLYRYENNNDDEHKYCKLATHVLCNSVAMLSLFSQHYLVIYFFFALQGIAAVVQVVIQLSKKKYLAASVNAIMGSVRFFQAYQTVAPYLPKSRRFQRIDSREPIKQQLTEQEEQIRLLCGNEYLYFKQNGPEEKFLILSTEADHNGALNPKYITGLINQLSNRFDVKYRTISVVEDIQREITSATQFGRVTGLMLWAHGSPKSILLSYNLANGSLTNETISPDLFSGLDPSCVIALRSCSTGYYPYFSLAYRVANRSKRITFAAADVTNIITLKQLDPLEFSFERYGKPVGTRKIQPLKDDSFITFLKSLFTSKQENISIQNNSRHD